MWDVGLVSDAVVVQSFSWEGGIRRRVGSCEDEVEINLISELARETEKAWRSI